MKENKQKKNVKFNGPAFDEDMEIFGEHKTKEQVRAEEKERRIAERKAMLEEIERRRKEAKENGTVPAKRKDVIVVSAVLVAIILLCLLALGNSFRKAKEEQQWMANESRGHYANPSAYPSMSGDGPKAEVLEVYFTQNNHLCVELIISNGTDRMIDIESMDVTVYNYETEERIAGGKAMLAEDFIIEVASTDTYTFYIAPEHIYVEEGAALPEMSFNIILEHVPVEVE